MKAKLVDKKEEAKGTKSFFFEPEKHINYLPGQYMYYTLPKLLFPDLRGGTRHFTISSSPTEGYLLRLTTRIREQSGYKKTLDALSMESFVDIEGPSGTFILDENDLPAKPGKGSHVFLAGGIGVTPFRSMIKYVFDKNLPFSLHLIYSNSIPEEIAFRKELEHYSDLTPNFKLSETVSKPLESKAPWKGLTGRIDANFIKNVVNDLKSPTFWVCGPPPMVDSMEQVLKELNVPSSNVKWEKFDGY